MNAHTTMSRSQTPPLNLKTSGTPIPTRTPTSLLEHPITPPNQQKRLRHLSGLSARKLSHALLKYPGDVYFTLHRNSESESFYTSEIVYSTLNPSWKPIDHTQIKHGIHTSVKSFFVRVWLLSPRNSNLNTIFSHRCCFAEDRCNSVASETQPEAYECMNTHPPIHANTNLILEWDIDMSGLEVIAPCKNPSTYGSHAVDLFTNIQFQPNTLVFQLDTCNTLPGSQHSLGYFTARDVWPLNLTSPAPLPTKKSVQVASFMLRNVSNKNLPLQTRTEKIPPVGVSNGTNDSIGAVTYANSPTRTGRSNTSDGLRGHKGMRGVRASMIHDSYSVKQLTCVMKLCAAHAQQRSRIQELKNSICTMLKNRVDGPGHLNSCTKLHTSGLTSAQTATCTQTKKQDNQSYIKARRVEELESVKEDEGYIRTFERVRMNVVHLTKDLARVHMCAREEAEEMAIVRKECARIRQRLTFGRQTYAHNVQLMNTHKIAMGTMDENNKCIDALIGVRRQKLIRQIASVYPIHRLQGGVYRITTVILPSIADFSAGGDDEQTATALGFAAHFLSTLARLLAVPLRYPILLKGSRSAIAQNITPLGPQTYVFPLYGTGVDRSAYIRGVTLLNWDCYQVMAIAGVNGFDLRDILKTLQRLVIAVSHANVLTGLGETE